MFFCFLHNGSETWHDSELHNIQLDESQPWSATGDIMKTHNYIIISCICESFPCLCPSMQGALIIIYSGAPCGLKQHEHNYLIL